MAPVFTVNEPNGIYMSGRAARSFVWKYPFRGKKRGNKMKKRTFIGLTVAAAVLLAVIGIWLYTADYYHAAPDVMEQLSEVEAGTDSSGNWLVSPADGQVCRAGFLFYPGGKVEESAYLPLISRIAEAGYFCVIVKMPLHLAVLDIHAASRIREEYQEIETWFIGGHSLGGAMAQAEVCGNPESYAGLILLAAYGTKDMSAMSVPSRCIYGSQDGVMNREKLEEGKSLMPSSYEEFVLSGANHAGFGYYGAQDGDGTAQMKPQEQWDQTAELMLQLFKRSAGGSVRGNTIAYGHSPGLSS